MDRENALDADAVGDFAHGKHLGVEAALPGDDGPFIDLDAFLFSLNDLNVNPHGVPDFKARDGFFLQRPLDPL